MEKKRLTIEYEEYASAAELPETDFLLLQAAVDALKGSYAPYSHFNVGSAVLLEDGTVVKGSNQENAAYPSGLCAERTAMFAAGAQYPGRKFTAIAVVCSQNGELLPSPGYSCGACRQVMVQYERESGRQLRIIFGSRNNIQIFNGVASIMPFLFDDL